MESRALRIRLALAVALGVPTALFAGVFEIDQRCVAVGCFPGDLAGFPVTISSPGEYRLTSNLDTRFSPSPADLTAIQVTAGGGVDIDLNGFEVRGPVSCVAGTSTCSPVGFGGGISGNTGTSVRDGTVRGFAQNGVSTGGSARIERVRTWDNGHHGIYAGGEGAVVVESIAFRNGDEGIHTYRYATIRGVTVARNGDRGIHAEQSSRVEEAIAWSNGGHGITTDVVMSVYFSVSNQNVGSGFGGYPLVCVADANIGYGLRSGLDTELAIQDVFWSNVAGAIEPGAFSLGQNNCNGSAC